VKTNRVRCGGVLWFVFQDTDELLMLLRATPSLYITTLATTFRGGLHTDRRTRPPVVHVLESDYLVTRLTTEFAEPEYTGFHGHQIAVPSNNQPKYTLELQKFDDRLDGEQGGSLYIPPHRSITVNYEGNYITHVEFS